MLFHILPIPIPEIKLGLPLEALSVLWIPRLTVLHSVNTCMKLNILWQGVATLPDNGNVMHYLLQIFCLCIYVLISVRSKPVIWMKRYGRKTARRRYVSVKTIFVPLSSLVRKPHPSLPLCPVAKLHTGKQIPRIRNVTHLTYFPLSAFEMDH